MNDVKSDGATEPVQSLLAAREYVRSHIREGDEGVICPCCDQLCALRKRKLNKTMAECLISLVRAHEQSGLWIHVSGIKLRGTDARSAGGEFAKLANWGLIEVAPNLDPSKRMSGYWRPTISGIAFAKGQVMVASHVLLYNNEILGWSSELITITGALGRPFDYAADGYASDVE